MTTSIRDLRKWKGEGKKFTMLTAYDYTTARWLDHAGIPVLLVGGVARRPSPPIRSARRSQAPHR